MSAANFKEDYVDKHCTSSILSVYCLLNSRRRLMGTSDLPCDRRYFIGSFHKVFIVGNFIRLIAENHGIDF
jgi:hypothetical protein